MLIEASEFTNVDFPKTKVVVKVDVNNKEAIKWVVERLRWLADSYSKEVGRV